MFDSLLKAVNGKHEALEDLVKAAGDADQLSEFGVKSSKASIKAPKFLTKKAKKSPNQSGSPAKASKKTTTQLDSSLQPTKKLVTTPNGTVPMTVHEGAMSSPNLVVGAGNKKGGKKGGGNTKPVNKKKVEGESGPTHVSHAAGGTVVAGHKQDQIPVIPELDHVGKWYHDNLKAGDIAKFNAFSQEHQGWFPIESEVTEMNPGGQKYFHVKHPSKDFQDDPDAPAFPVHYNKIHEFKRKSDENPHQWHTFKYGGEYEQPDQSAPTDAKPNAKLDPNAVHQHIEKKQQLIKKKTDAIKKHLEPGDVIEFWLRDPTTGKTAIHIGTAYSGGESQAAKARSKGASGQDGKKELNHVSVQTADGYEDVPLDRVHRFGKYVVDNLHMYSFNPDSVKWELDGMPKENTMHPDEAAKIEAKPTAQVHGAKLDSNQQPSMLGQDKPKDIPTSIAGEPALPEPPLNKEMPDALPVDKQAMFQHFGAKYVGEDEEGNVFFTHPGQHGIYQLHANELTPEKIQNTLGQKPSEQEVGIKHPEEAQEPDYKNHWTQKLDEDTVGLVRGVLDQVDKLRDKEGELLPPMVLAARHNLLHTHNSIDAMKNAAIINSYLKNPTGLQFVAKPQPTSKDFADKLNTKDFDSLSGEQVREKLAGKKPGTSFLAKRQADVVNSLADNATNLNLGSLANEIRQIDPSKDNRELLNYYKMRVLDKAKENGSAAPDLKLNIPTEEHVQNDKHLHDLVDYMHKEGLSVPAYQKKAAQLNYFLNSEPNSPLVPQMFNDLHHYIYDRGNNDPHFVLSNLRQELGKKKIEPEVQHSLDSLFDQAEEGQLKPEDALRRVNNVIKANKIKVEEQEPVNYNRSEWAKSRLDNLVEARKIKQESDEMKKQAEDATKELANAGKTPPTATNPIDAAQGGPVMPNPQKPDPSILKVQKTAQDLASKIKNKHDAIAEILAAKKEGHSGSDDDHLHSVLMTALKFDAPVYNKLVEQLAQHGIQMPQYELPGQAKGSGHAEEIDNIYKEHDDKNRQWLQGTLETLKHRINIDRKHFLHFAGRFDPAVHEDLKNLDTMAKDMIASNNWQPISETEAQTPDGVKFIKMMNSHILGAHKRAKMAGIPLDEVGMTKSLNDVLAAEKTLARRDISLALRKAFYNDVDSPELKRTTSLLAAYVDDFLDAVFDTYPNLPAPVRKSIARTLLKSVIREVVKDNVYSAVTMDKDFTAPLTDEVIKSMGQEIASLVTEFRMETTDKQMLVIDLNKSVKSTYRAITPFITELKVVKGDLTPAEWENKLSALEVDMQKANFFDSHISQHRIRKFIADNDQKSLQTFFNDNLKLLKDRLKSMENE